MGTFQSPPPPPTQQPIAKVDGEVARVDPAWADWFMRFRQSAQGISLLPTPFTAGDLFFALNTTDVSLLHDVVAGNALLSGGVGLAPAWGKVGLTTHVTGILPIANGGTNSAGPLSGSSIMISNGSSIVQGAAGTTTTVLHGNAAGSPTYSAVSLTADVTGVLPVGNGGTGTSTQFTSGSIVFAGASGIYQQDNSNFFWDSTNHFLGLGTASPAARAHLSGAISTTAWLLSGIALRVDAATYTDTTSVAGGNIAASAFAIPTFANTAGGTNTYAKASTVYIAGAPLHGTGALFTNTYPLYIESGQGRSFLGDIVDVATGYRVNGSTSTTGQLLRYDGTNFTPSSNTYPNTATRGDLLMATATNVIGNLADVATGNALISGGVGSIPSWGKISLTTTISGILPEANGGTNQSTYTTGDLLYASAANTLSKLADVAAGSYLRSGGVGTAPLWSTLTLPNAATTGDILIASATNVISRLADVATGNALLSGGVGVAPAWGKVDLGTAVTGTLLAAQFPALTGDVTTVAGALATTLASVNSNVGTFGSATQAAQVTVNAKGLVTAAANVTITGTAPGGAAGGDLSGTYPNPSVQQMRMAELLGFAASFG